MKYIIYWLKSVFIIILVNNHQAKVLFFFTQIVFFLHCLWIYPAPWSSTSVLRELYCYDLLHLGVSKQFWRRCRGSCCVFRGNFWEQSTIGGNSSIGNFVPFFSLILSLFFCLFLIYLIWLAFIVAWAFGLETRMVD